jgi:hypothetical protein
MPGTVDLSLVLANARRFDMRMRFTTHGARRAHLARTASVAVAIAAGTARVAGLDAGVAARDVKRRVRRWPGVC